MPEDIQNLLDRIEREGVAKAESERKKILSDAESKAMGIIQSARDEAEKILREARRDAELSSKRAVEGIRQSARDIIISLKNELIERLRRIVKRNVNDVMTAEFIRELILQIVKNGKESGNLKIILPKARLQELQDKLLNSLAADLREKPAIFADSGITSGFKVGFKGEDVMLDFSDEAFADLICEFAGPSIAAVLKDKGNS